MLLESDKKYLESRGFRYSLYEHGSLTLLVIHDFELPLGHAPQVVDLLIQIPSNYPDAKLDMWWVYPAVVFADTRAEPAAAAVREVFSSFTPEPARQWQRFSRHPEWRPGIDDLRTYLGSLRSTMESEARQVAA